MKKKKEKQKNEYVIMFALSGFTIGSGIWFWIYFSKSGLYFDKLLIYMIGGMIIGGIVGEIVNHFKK